MARQYRVVDCRSKLTEALVGETLAVSPEEAAWLILGETLVRSGHPRDLRARVYFRDAGGPLTMVRLYSKAAYPA